MMATMPCHKEPLFASAEESCSGAECTMQDDAAPLSPFWGPEPAPLALEDLEELLYIGFGVNPYSRAATMLTAAVDGHGGGARGLEHASYGGIHRSGDAVVGKTRPRDERSDRDGPTPNSRDMRRRRLETGAVGSGNEDEMGAGVLGRGYGLAPQDEHEVLRHLVHELVLATRLKTRWPEKQAPQNEATGDEASPAGGQELGIVDGVPATTGGESTDVDSMAVPEPGAALSDSGAARTAIDDGATAQTEGGKGKAPRAALTSKPRTALAALVNAARKQDLYQQKKLQLLEEENEESDDEDEDEDDDDDSLDAGQAGEPSDSLRKKTSSNVVTEEVTSPAMATGDWSGVAKGDVDDDEEFGVVIPGMANQGLFHTLGSSGTATIPPGTSGSNAALDQSNVTAAKHPSQMTREEFLQQFKRAPRRGELGTSADEIAAAESLGYVMSGSRSRGVQRYIDSVQRQLHEKEAAKLQLQFLRVEDERNDTAVISSLLDMLKKQRPA